MSAPVVPQAKTPKSKAGLLTRPFRSLPGGRLAKSAKVPEQLSGASGADFRKTQKAGCHTAFWTHSSGYCRRFARRSLGHCGGKDRHISEKTIAWQRQPDRKSNFPANFSPHSHLSHFEHIDNQYITKTQAAFGYFLRYPSAGRILLIY